MLALMWGLVLPHSWPAITPFYCPGYFGLCFRMGELVPYIRGYRASDWAASLGVERGSRSGLRPCNQMDLALYLNPSIDQW